MAAEVRGAKPYVFSGSSGGLQIRLGMKLASEKEKSVEERSGEAFEAGEQLTVLGAKLRPGEKAPAFALDFLDPAGSMHTLRLADSAGTVRVLSTVNSVDTPVCNVETRRWESLRQDLPTLVTFYTVSMDLPFALARWQEQQEGNHQLLSAHREEAFGSAYGTLIKEWRLLQRAVFVIDAQDQIVYAEYVSDQMAEPNYEAALEAARRAAK
jgi:thiol peroxidase